VNALPPPDPTRGVFETLLVADGRPVETDAHFERLATSVREIFAVDLPAAVRADTERECAGIELGRVRIDVVPDADGELTHTVATAPIDPSFPFPSREDGDALRSVSAPGWAGAHKWADRGWLERTEEELGEEVPLIVAEDGAVLEAGRANLFAIEDGGLLTPPADGRILPGTARAATIEIARELGVPVAERTLTLADLRAAEDVFLTSSVRGLRPVRSLDGTPLIGSGDLVNLLATRLHERWHGAAARG
jgi:para-aminobenzoate synthetase/4-amino-4-deoxychorismate lyase